jgi:hypothetical protein
MNDKNSIRRQALALIAADASGVASRLAAEFGLSRQVANAYLSGMVKDGLIEASGTTRARTYRLKVISEADRSFVREGLDEDRVWRELVKPVVADLPRNVQDIWHYAATEMINNAIDHSGSLEVLVQVRRTALDTEVTVIDQGEGIFHKIQRVFDLLDLFEIDSHHLRFSHQSLTEDRIAEHAADTPGTRVRMRLENDSPKTLLAVFQQFTEGEETDFARTVVPLRLAQHEGDKLVSRSQAKRVVYRFERFRKVELDFTGVEEIGQAFADELFRVYARSHPEISITPINTTPAVDMMIRRAVNAPVEGTS